MKNILLLMLFLVPTVVTANEVGSIKLASAEQSVVTEPINSAVATNSNETTEAATFSVVTDRIIVYKTFIPILPQYFAFFYPDAPDIEEALSIEIPKHTSFTYDKSRDKNSKGPTQRYKAETVYLGSPEGYAEQLASNTALAGIEIDRNQKVGLFAVLTSVATKGAISVDGAGKYGYQRKFITADLVKDLPPGAKKILVTRITRFDGTFQESLTAAYGDITDAKLRWINYEEGMKRIMWMKEL